MKEISIQESIQTMVPQESGASQKNQEQEGSFLETLTDAIGEVNKLHKEADMAICKITGYYIHTKSLRGQTGSAYL